MRPTKCNPDGYVIADSRCERTWVEDANFRQPTVRLQGKRKASQKTTGDNYASKAHKKAHPEYYWEGTAKKQGKAHKRIIRKGKTIKKMEVR